MTTKTQRAPYSEQETATMLGVSVDHLRSMVKAYVVKDDDMPEDWIAALQPSDLLLLRVLSGMVLPDQISTRSIARNSRMCS